MRTYIEIGPAPSEEECAQLGTEGCHARMRDECRRFIAAIRAKFGPEPGSARLAAKTGCGTAAHFGRCLDCGADLIWATGADPWRDVAEGSDD